MVQYGHSSKTNMTPEKQLENPTRIIDNLNETGLFDAKVVGSNTVSAISIMGEHEELAGNVLRRICTLGGEACAQTCVLHQGVIERAQVDIDGKCADENLAQVIEKLGLRPENVFMVGVGKDNIGFLDQVDQDREKYKYTISSVTGLKELPGFDAFFSAEGDTVAGDEVYALGRRLADCGDVNIEFVDRDGRRVMGFVHMSKPNLQGEGAQRYDYNGQKVGSFEYFLRTALDHYGGHISTVDIRVAAAIKPEHYVWKFQSEAEMDERGFIGWEDTLDEEGKPLLKNQSNPDSQPGQPFDPNDEWFADFPAMLRWQMAQLKDLKPDQINWEGAIDPGDTGSDHASNHRGKTNPGANGRDAYFTAWADKIHPQT